MKYTLDVAGLKRDLLLCPINENLMIGAFLIMEDPELTVACAAELLKRAPSYDYILTAETKSIPLAHEMAKQNKDKAYFVARKNLKLYMHNPVKATLRSITTDKVQNLILSEEQAHQIRGKRILIVDDVISTGESLRALEELTLHCGGIIVGKMAVLAEGDAAKREDIIFLEKLPLFNNSGKPLE